METTSSGSANARMDVMLAVLPPMIPEFPPVELAQAAEYLRQTGLDVCARDLNIDLFAGAGERRNLWSHAEINNWAEDGCLADYVQWLGIDYDRIAEDLGEANPRFLFFYVHRPNLTLTRRIARRIKKARPNVRIVFGGPSTTIVGERLLIECEEADFLIVGELELTLAELVARTKAGSDLAFTQGLMRPGDDAFRPRPPMLNLDALPFPTYSDFDLSAYLRPEVPIRASRGCPERCAFCSEQSAAGFYRARAAASVVAEIAHHAAAGRTDFVFEDLIANGDLDQLAAVADGLADAGLKIRWEAKMTPRGEMTYELFTKLARAGLGKVVFGLESGSDRVLGLMNKGYTSRDATDCIQAAAAAGIDVHVNLLVGFPGEEAGDLLDTARFLKQNQKFINWIDAIFPCYLLPGCALERDFEAYGLWLPPEQHYRMWHHRNRNNFSYREKKVKELALFITDLDVHFNVDLFVPPGDALRAIADKVKQRFHEQIKTRPEVALIAMPPWGVNNPPVGLAYLSSYLRDHGVRTEVLDYNIRFFNSLPQEYELLWHVENKNYWSNDDTWSVIRHAMASQLEEAAAEILATGCAVIGFSVVDPRERVTIDMIKRIRQTNRHAKIVLGGPACHTPDYRRVFEEKAGDLIDGYCIGEGEETLLEVAQRVREGRPLAGTPGLLSYENGEQVFTPRPPIADLSTLSFPRYEEFRFADYPGDSLILEWSRGCIGTCTYCKGKEIGGGYRTRPAEHIFRELKHQVEVNGYDNFTICDPLLNGDLEVLDELCDRIIAAGYKIRWNGECLPRKGMSRELMAKVGKAGCYEIQWGLECASDKVLKLMGKARHFAVADAAEVIKASHDAGIKTALFILTGFPGETAEDAQKTVDFIRANSTWIDQIKSINSVHIITDTPLHKHADKFGVVLPEVDYHYRWSTADGTNTHEERNRRTREILKACKELGIEVLETNLAEGKQYDLAAKVTRGSLEPDEQVRVLLAQVNKLESFDTGDGRPLPLSRDEAERAGAIVDGCAPEPSADQVPGPVADGPAPDPGEPSPFILENRDLVGFADTVKPYAGPEIVEIDLTNNCNLNCAGCWCHSDMLKDKKLSGEKKRRMLDFDLAVRLIDEAAEMGVKRFQLAGAGEPFVHPKIMQIIERIKSKGMKVTIITNFTLIDKKKAERLVELGVDNITASVWAGSPEVYQKTHPNQKGKRLAEIQKVLRHLHAVKRERGVFYPQVKIYNVISHLNADGISDMVSFATKSLVDYIEFTPIDIVKGYTDELALTAEDRAVIIDQLNDLPKHPDYIELDPGQNPVKAEATAHGKEFARFVKRDILPEGFRYELDDIRRFDVLCPRKEWKLDIQEDNQVENALLFYYPRHECEGCPLAKECKIDTERYVVKVEFTSFLGFGAFFRRISSETAETGTYDSNAVNEIPCYVGWTYARVLTTGDVIPCCKADKVSMGNLTDRSFREIWTARRYDTFRHKAYTLPKDDAYFSAIRCLDACDNLGMNVASDEKWSAITEDQRNEVRGWVGVEMLLLTRQEDK